MKITVVGGGVIGLNTALQLKEEWPNANINVIAESFDNTTSHVAAGIFRVGSSFFGPNDVITNKWITDAYNYYYELYRSRDASEAGVASISGYIFGNSEDVTRSKLMKDIVPLLRPATKREFQLVEGNWKYGSFMTTILTQPNYYLPWAYNKLKENNVTFETKKIGNLNEIARENYITFNCTGIGAREICGDNKLCPVRGQVEKVDAPWIKTFFYGDVGTYIIPGLDGSCTLGGVRDLESWDLKICHYQALAIRDRCEKLIPSLRKAKHILHKTGLRPFRNSGVRVEIEKNNYGVVIHNYGHGGYGVCTAPGTSKYAVKLATNFHKSSSKL